MNELFGNMISTSNKQFSHYERDIVDGEQCYGQIMFEVGRSLFYTPVYIGNRASINTTRLFQTSEVVSASTVDNMLTVNTRNSVYTFSLKT
jgi:hypothetical protein